MKWYLRACRVCRGDLHEDRENKGWVTCFMCSRSFWIADIALREQNRVAPRGLADKVEVKKAA